MGAPSHDGGQAGAGHIGDLTHGCENLAMGRAGLSVVDGGEARGDAGLAGGDCNVPGFESGDGAGGSLDFLGGVSGRQRRDRHDGAIGRHGLPRDRMKKSRRRGRGWSG